VHALALKVARLGRDYRRAAIIAPANIPGR